jgi:hypothetical protein
MKQRFLTHTKMRSSQQKFSLVSLPFSRPVGFLKSFLIEIRFVPNHRHLKTEQTEQTKKIKQEIMLGERVDMVQISRVKALAFLVIAFSVVAGEMLRNESGT